MEGKIIMREFKEYIISENVKVDFHNKVDFCVGTGRMGLALQKEYQEQLKLVQEHIKFQYIRGHGLFSDDMGIYQEYINEDNETVAEYNFTYLDLVMDNYRSVGLRPFLELGFMPDKMASGNQTVFYWKGNVTPPKDYEDWCKLVQATLKHLIERYGEEEVVHWPVEVWNEPNLNVFWKDADMKEYFRLFEVTFNAVKGVNERFQVGGPAICGVMDELWIHDFLAFCREKKIQLDFITRHHYTTEVPKMIGHYGYTKLIEPRDGFANLQITRDIIDSFEEYKNLPIHITEFNTSYIPNCPLHDTNQNAAYIAHQLSRLGDVNESYSYWTFGDIFEESGIPFTPFHGGFGLVANGCIPKPTFWTFQFFKQLEGKCVHKSDEAVIIRRKDGSYCGVAWNSSMIRIGRELELRFLLPVLEQAEICKEKEFCILTKTVDESVCNPLKIWHDMGEPSSLSEVQKQILREGAKPMIHTERKECSNHMMEVLVRLEENAVIYFEVFMIKSSSDRGYSYKKVMQYE